MHLKPFDFTRKPEEYRVDQRQSSVLIKGVLSKKLLNTSKIIFFKDVFPEIHKYNVFTRGRFVLNCHLFLLQDEPGAPGDPMAGLDHDWLNGVPGSSSSAAQHQATGPKKKRHRVTRHEKDKEQHVGGKLLVAAGVQSEARGLASHFLPLSCLFLTCEFITSWCAL